MIIALCSPKFMLPGVWRMDCRGARACWEVVQVAIRVSGAGAVAMEVGRSGGSWVHATARVKMCRRNACEQ